MTPGDIALVLTKAAAFDQRTIGEADVLAWHELLERVELADALDAVRRHYSTTRDRLMPADVLRHARIVRDERQRLEARHEVRALPGRFEDDADRDARMREGVAKVRKAIAPMVARMSLENERTWQRRPAAGGAWWEDDDKREQHARQLLAEAGRLHICNDRCTCDRGGSAA